MPKKAKLPLGGVCLTLLFSLLCLVSNAQKTVTGKVNRADSKPAANLGAQLQGRATGVTVSGSGALDSLR